MKRLSYRDSDGRARLTLYGKKMYCSTQATADCFCRLEERNEPKPPGVSVAYNKIFYACYNCGKSLMTIADREGLKMDFDNAPKYCSECGQKVKWNE